MAQYPYGNFPYPNPVYSSNNNSTNSNNSNNSINPTYRGYASYNPNAAPYIPNFPLMTAAPPVPTTTPSPKNARNVQPTAKPSNQKISNMSSQTFNINNNQQRNISSQQSKDQISEKTQIVSKKGTSSIGLNGVSLVTSSTNNNLAINKRQIKTNSNTLVEVINSIKNENIDWRTQDTRNEAFTNIENYLIDNLNDTDLASLKEDLNLFVFTIKHELKLIYYRYGAEGVREKLNLIIEYLTHMKNQWPWSPTTYSIQNHPYPVSSAHLPSISATANPNSSAVKPNSFPTSPTEGSTFEAMQIESIIFKKYYKTKRNFIDEVIRFISDKEIDWLDYNTRLESFRSIEEILNCKIHSDDLIDMRNALKIAANPIPVELGSLHFHFHIRGVHNKLLEIIDYLNHMKNQQVWKS